MGWNSPKEKRERLYKQIETLQRKLTRLEELYLDGDIPKERYKDKRSELTEGVASIQTELDTQEDIESPIQVAEESRRFLLNNPFYLFGDGPVASWITTHALFAPHKYLSPELQDQLDWITPEKRQGFYRRMNLHVTVGGRRRSAWRSMGALLLVRVNGLQVVLAAPRELRKAQLQRAITLRCGLQHPYTGARYLGPDAVSPITAISTIPLC